MAGAKGLLHVKAEVRVVVVLEPQGLLGCLHARLLDKRRPKVMLLETEVQSRLVSNSCTRHNFQSFSPFFVTACCMHIQIPGSVARGVCSTLCSIRVNGTKHQGPSAKLQGVCHGMSIRSGAEKQVTHLTAAVCKSCH